MDTSGLDTLEYKIINKKINKLYTKFYVFYKDNNDNQSKSLLLDYLFNFKMLNVLYFMILIILLMRYVFVRYNLRLRTR